MLPLLAVIAVVGGGSEGDTQRPVISREAGRHYWDS